jgi:hypothetical protein
MVMPVGLPSGRFNGGFVAPPMTFTMPRTSDSSAGGAAFVDQRLSPDFGMLAIAVADHGTAAFLHEIGHAFGFPHVGSIEAVGELEYGSCGGARMTPDTCTCAARTPPGSSASAS